ncbi:AI-2E family transporter [Synechococcus sp. RSCCF101]|uniref:AI-2E family transporter n=1 Tax=Synechococcus sp. RSCCF101 TaxID=2511069 RepID=UPI00178195C7|nr:AI-2E family transporter [Synechococcus sp. RSCCF101]
MRTNRQVIDLTLQLVTTGGLVAWCVLVISPFLSIIIWAVILAIGLHSSYRWLLQHLGGRSGLAALVILIAGLAVILGPLGFLIINLAGDARALAESVATGSLALPPSPAWLSDVPLIGPALSQTWADSAADFPSFLEQIKPALANLGQSLLGSGANVLASVLQLIVALIVSLALMINAASLRKRLGLVAKRLAPEQADAFIDLATSTLQHVIRGVIGVALVQTLLIGIAFVLAGIPWAGVLIGLCLVLSLVQVGPALVVLPVLIYAWTSLGTLTALLLTLWLIPAGLIDNVLKPIWMAKGLPVPLVVVLLGVLGGTLTYGLTGLFTGPVILSLGYSLLRLWVRDPVHEPGLTPAA